MSESRKVIDLIQKQQKSVMQKIEMHVGTVINQTQLERTIETTLKDYFHQIPDI